MLNFDLTKNPHPPTAEEIETERSRLISVRKNLNFKRAGAFTLAAIAVFTMILALRATPTLKETPELRWVLAAVSALLGLSLFSVFRAINGYFFLADFLRCEDRLSCLQNLPDGQAPPLIEACLTDNLCDLYRLKVAEQGRSLIVAEAVMLRDWVTNADRRATLAERKHLVKITTDRLANQVSLNSAGNHP